jgi:DNA polymerase (family 10)
MSNKELANQFRYLAELMELHNENPFKIRSYNNAYLALRKTGTPLAEMSLQEMEQIPGIGKAISGKIQELLQHGKMSAVEKLEEKTPPGLRELLQIPGFGPKKISVIWQELGIESIGELLYACNENRLVELKGFGPKTQADLRQKLEYYLKVKGQFLYADLEQPALSLIEKLSSRLPGSLISLTGDIRRKCMTLHKIELLLCPNGTMDHLFDGHELILQSHSSHSLEALYEQSIPILIYLCTKDAFGRELFLTTGTPAFTNSFVSGEGNFERIAASSESEFLKKAGLADLPPELRETAWNSDAQLPALIELEDIKGVVHAHSTYSDGLNSVRQMAVHAREMGYHYLGISDHSKSAFYANGLKEDRLMQQWEEIETLNKELAPFKIFKGIESDILSDGSLDYSDDILQQFDFVIASIHSNLKMDIDKATNRLLKAIENPFTTMLGHPTGRLLLHRAGYPVDMKKIIDACADNGVAIELNANPYRLDLDWHWISMAQNKGVMISINPDAHSCTGIGDIRYGVYAARKGGLVSANCLTALTAADFELFIS